MVTCNAQIVTADKVSNFLVLHVQLKIKRKCQHKTYA